MKTKHKLLALYLLGVALILVGLIVQDTYKAPGTYIWIIGSVIVVIRRFFPSLIISSFEKDR